MKKYFFVLLFITHTFAIASGLKSNCRVALGDYSEAQKINVHSLVTPKSISELQQVVRTTNRPVAVRGAGFSMGGQTAASNGVVVEMSKLNKIIELDVAAKTITVQAGVTWRQIQEVIDKQNLSVGVMQSYNNFQVGGALSVNAHGRYVGNGPIIPTVLEINVMLADGSVIIANRSEHADLFSGAIGGYAGLGIITQAKLQLVDNTKVERNVKTFKNDDISIAARQVVDHFNTNIRGNPDAVFWNADIYPTKYNQIDSIAFSSTDKAVTNAIRIQPPAASGGPVALWESLQMSVEQLFNYAKNYRANSVAPAALAKPKVVYRNNEASFDNRALQPLNDRLKILKNPLVRKALPFLNRKALLQEYFIPTDKLPEFLARMKGIFLTNDVNITNVSLRHVPPNNESVLSWSKVDSMAVVVYYTQTYGNAREANLGEAKDWTRKMISEVEAVGGSFYLPYQIYATRDQFHTAYPNSEKFFALKRKYDPNGKFNNSLWELYNLTADTYFYRDLLATTEGKVELEKYFTNIFSLHNPQKFLNAIETAMGNIRGANRDLNDRNIYEELLRVFPTIAESQFEILKKTLPALRTQQNEMATQTAAILKAVGVTGVTNYVEIGSPGRYILPLGEQIRMRGKTYVINDQFGARDWLETSYGAAVPASLTSKHIELGNYDMIHQGDIPNDSVGLSTMYIGLHHCPPEQLMAFLSSINRMTKPGGYFVLRDHDANERLLAMAFLAHSTYNAGLNIPYGAELNEVRNLHPLSYWIAALERAGFRYLHQQVLQDGDPTGNTLMLFEKIRDFDNATDGPVRETVQETIVQQRQAQVGLSDPSQLNVLPGYHRPQSNTYMTQPEWLAVDMFAELANFLRHSPGYEFPFDGFLALYNDVYKVHREFANHEGIQDKRAFESYDQMDRQLYWGNWLLFKTIKYFLNKSRPKAGRTEEETQAAVSRLVSSQWFLADFFKGYAEFMIHTPWYQFGHKVAFQKYEEKMWETGSLTSTENKKIDKSLLKDAMFLFRAMDVFGGFTRWTLKDNVVDPNTQFLIEASQADLSQLSSGEAKELQDLGNNLRLMETERYMPFTQVMADLATTDAKVINVAGNEHISVILSSPTKDLPTMDVHSDLIMTYQYPTNQFEYGNKNYFYTVRVRVADLPKFLSQAGAHNLKIMRVHDY